MSLVIHEQRKPKMQPFYWVLTFEMHVLGILLGLAFTMGPFILLYLWANVWTWMSLAAIPAGIFMVIRLSKSLKGHIWNNTHLDEYLLYEDHIEYERWNIETKDSLKGSLRIGDIKAIYYGRYIFQFSYAYRNSKMTESVPMAELMPIMYLVAGEGQAERAVAVPFTDPMEANRWLEVIGRRGIPLYLTSVIIQDLGDESVASLLREDEDLERAEFDGNIERQFRPYLDRLVQENEEEDRELTEEERDQLEYEMKLLEYEEALQKRRSAFRGTGLLAWLVFPVQFAVGFWLTRQAELGNADPEQPLYPVLLVALSAVLFFFLVKWMRWLQIIMFSLVTFVSFMFLDFSEIETDPSYQMSSMLLAIAMLSLPVAALFYLGIRYVRKGRDAKNLPPMPGSYQPLTENDKSGFESGDRLST
ncbi:hypothetical protein SAMN04488688_103373 [Paenibacillus sp. cl141a]|uniref:hypothetical protein n=1 Tax=Paenibacillus sp. cl141a TaxID=1761877 RepID=UPI0008ACF168|nr:hypothetical protein [Paenibacillus sp. cl141a]SEL28396.1 hypothetical protein SAMN04488688_103373 [Paenibacillus sp. cl141a]